MTDVIRPRRYYKARKSGGTGASIHLEDLREILFGIYSQYEGSGYFVNAFGFECVDLDFEPGIAGVNVDAYVRVALESGNIWPIESHYKQYEEDDIFSLIEFLFDHISKPLQKTWHDWNNCGYHYSNFDPAAGQAEFRERINVPLGRYGDGWELSEDGEILSLPPEGMAKLLEAKPPTKDPTTQQKVAQATQKFRRFGSTMSERTDAIRDLADVLEWLRPQIKETLLKEDEKELFLLANNFGIRHLNQKQKLNYDKAVWLSWMFYHYLNTINAFLHMVRRQNDNK